MSDMKEYIEQADDELLPRLVIDAFRRIVVHYGYWFAQVEHQLGMEKAMDVEQEVWGASIGNQLKRLLNDLQLTLAELRQFTSSSNHVLA